ncbi:MAG: glycerol-3-phosphate dehydrogenase/oxidase [Saprospiraceae bacterium]|nr:glycerol-3-phosphate dehydrogenase/oxidase [Saprospiraceae bacterium]
MATVEYDLLVVGGGITGAGIALDAASRGLKVALVEKHDFAWGTSSRSTKLIHGGLRYLKQFEVALVREVGMERAIVHRNARHIVIPEKMLLPIVEGGSLGQTMSSIGLWVYDLLAGVENDERRKMLNKEETMDAEPMLRKDILKGGGLYYEYRTDDARLTIENMKSAVEHGANCVNYTEVTDYIYENEKVVGAIVKDNISEKSLTIRAKKIVNAAGPWVDKLRTKDTDGVQRKRLHLTKGVHIVVPYEKLPIQQAVYFDVEDGRMIFAIPREGVTYVGTTDTNYTGEIGEPYTNQADIDYTLSAINKMFPEVNLETKDVVSTWAGLRPLIHEDGKSPSELSRKDEIFESSTGLLSIAGGKLTGYRKMAERIVDLVVKQLQSEDKAYRNLKDCQTLNMRLSGGDFDSTEAVEQFIIRRSGEVTQIEVPGIYIKYLVHKYGTNTDTIIEKAFELYQKIKDPELRIQMAELWYSVHHEMSISLCDYLIRRTGRLYFQRQELDELYPVLAKMMGELLDWDEAKTLREMAKFKKEYDAVLNF